ncbi:DUF411 domain-containing protein [Halopiger goleimassiliensis]|uniref:DUF411 domain-containing protein n=1 Tax=Halopiger goleimassiliensis TaxID=1293048 RepID=UPI0006776CCF|nr:DUF411 domain-containing protein [Halopiger goleimassiliensis]
MVTTRRRLCSAVGAAVLAGFAGCIGDSGDDSETGSEADPDDSETGSEADPDDSETGSEADPDDSETGSEADPETDAAGWAWSGTLPVETVVQHYDPSCSCCSRYASYLEDHGLAVEREETDDRGAVLNELGVPDDAASCHTVEVGSYLVEGHVPLEAVEELLAEEPDVDGIAAPGMPRNSPGMGPPGDEPLSIYSFDESGTVSEFTTV